jgi:hypothetical protein
VELRGLEPPDPLHAIEMTLRLRDCEFGLEPFWDMAKPQLKDVIAPQFVHLLSSFLTVGPTPLQL